MSVYLDIDLDYLVSPVRQKSYNDVRIYKHEAGAVSDYKKFIETLSTKGLLKVNEKRFFTNHRKSYTYWWIKKSKNMTVVHIDAHSDLYGIKTFDLTKLSDVDMACNNYLWYALRDGYIEKLFWIVPEGVYNLEDSFLPETFIPKDMLLGYEYIDGRLIINFKVKTREGDKEIEYVITTIENLPCFTEIEMMTVATSPEFTPENTDKEIEEVLNLLGAAKDEIQRIMKLHTSMPESQDLLT